MRATIAGTALSARLTAGCAVTILASLSVAACSGSLPSETLPSASGAASTTTPGDQPSSTVTATATATATATVTPSVTPTVTTRPPATPVVTAAPDTGGGGTAGFQDAPLLGLGAAAIAAGAGSIAYRRRALRNR
jgi:hypothetical protein